VTTALWSDRQGVWPAGVWLAGVWRLITDEGVTVGSAFGSDTATGMMPVAHRVAGVLAFRRS
jgi:hypothetical protein